MPVQAHPRFETETVARCEPGQLRRSGIRQRFGDADRRFPRRDGDLKTVFARVTTACDVAVLHAGYGCKDGSAKEEGGQVGVGVF